MRYTTIIDIRALPSIYRNQHVRLLYLHLALRAGYHDDDRDLCLVSLRRLAQECGLTLSATRHALEVLQRAALIEKFATGWRVRKYISQTTISPRIRSEKRKKEIAEADRREAEQREREAREAEHKRRLKEQYEKTGKTSFERMIDDLRAAAANGDLEAAERLKFWKNFDKTI